MRASIHVRNPFSAWGSEPYTLLAEAADKLYTGTANTNTAAVIANS